MGQPAVVTDWDAPSAKQAPIVTSWDEPSSGFLDRAGDYGLTAVKGAIGVPETVVGLADMVTGGYAGKALEQLGFRPEEANWFFFLRDRVSPAITCLYGQSAVWT